MRRLFGIGRWIDESDSEGADAAAAGVGDPPRCPLTSLSLTRRLPLLPFSSDIDRGPGIARAVRSLAEDSVAVFCDQTPISTTLQPIPFSFIRVQSTLPITPDNAS